MAHRVRSDVHLLQEVANELEFDNNPTCTKDNINESYSGTADTASSSGRTSEAGEDKSPNTTRVATDPNAAPVVLIYTDEQKITVDPTYNIVIDNLLADLSVQVSDIKVQHRSTPKPLSTSKEYSNPNPSLIGTRHAGSGPPPARVPPIETNSNSNSDVEPPSPRSQANPIPTSPKGHIKQNSAPPPTKLDPVQKGASLVWRKDHFLGIAGRYRDLLELLLDNLEYTAALSQGVDPAEMDQFARLLVNIFSHFNRTLPLIRELIEGEFKLVNEANKGAILRGNSMTSKIESAYSRKIGLGYLKLLFSDLFQQILGNDQLDLEIDPKKVSNRGLVAKNEEQLRSYVKTFLDRITSYAMIEKMPREIRAIAGFTAEYAKVYAPDQISPLVGGFVLLRYLTPAIVTPESFDLVPEGVSVTPKGRRNLILIAKVLQNISNAQTFDKKEEYMTVLNDVVNENSPRMVTYLNMISTDPLVATNKDVLPWEDLTFNVLDRFFETKKADLHDLFHLHRGLFNNINKIKAVLSKKYPNEFAAPLSPKGNSSPPLNNSADSPRGEHQSNSPTLLPNPQIPTLEDPNTSQTTTPSGAPAKRIMLSRSRTNFPEPTPANNGTTPAVPTRGTFSIGLSRRSSTTFDNDIEHSMKLLRSWEERRGSDKRSIKDYYISIARLLGEMGPPPVNSTPAKSNLTNTDTSADEDYSSFFYPGPAGKSGICVFYLIVSRITERSMSEPHKLIEHVKSTIDSATKNGNYSFVLDMSWSNFDTTMTRKFMNNIGTLIDLDYSYKKRMKDIWVVHPTPAFQAVFFFLKSFIKSKTAKKIRQFYNWRELTEVIALDNIMLPEQSKNFITKAYRVIKINAKNKKQERVIKFTPNSLLNIDPKSSMIQNEKMLDDIEEISCPSEKEIVLKFSELSMERDRRKKKSSIPLINNLTKSKKEDLAVRRYTCLTKADRDSIIEDIFASGYYLENFKGQQEFHIVKVNKVGKRQERTFKFTCDSLLNLDDQKIKTEISFAGIDQIKPDESDDKNIIFKSKLSASNRVLICRSRSERDSLLSRLIAAVAVYQSAARRQQDEMQHGVIDYFANQM
jgi:hypothetical protein